MKSRYESFSVFIGICGAAYFIFLLCLFVNHKDLVKYSNLGGSINGVVGTLFSLIGVLLFYSALKEQRNDIKINQDSFQQQLKEYQLQTQELEETRKVFKQQTETIRIQQFESTFFNMLGVLQEIINGLSIRENGEIIRGRDFFKIAFTTLKVFLEKHTKQSDKHNQTLINQILIKALIDQETLKNENLDKKNLLKKTDLDGIKAMTIEIYEDFYNSYHHNLGHYFRFIFNILKFTIESDLREDEKSRYINLIQAQMSSYELGLIFYNALSNNGIRMYDWLEKYGFLENIDSRALLSPIDIYFYPETSFKFNKTGK